MTPPSAPARGRPKLSFFVELKPGPLERLFADERVMAQLRALDATVTIGLVDLTDSRAAIVRMLNERGIPVCAWLLLSEEGGYWCNTGNAAEAWARYGDFHEWTAENRLRWDRVGIDIEPDIHDVRAVRENPWVIVARGLPRLFACIEDARELYQGLVARIRDDGYPVDAYVFPFIHHERRAGTTALQRLTGMLDLDVDREVCMLYTSFVRPHGPGFLDLYAPHFPAVAVGVTGGGVEEGIDPPPPLDWDEFARDLRLARRYTDDVHVFSLEGCVEQGWLERLASFDWDAPVDVASARARAETLTRRIEPLLRVLERPVLASALGGLTAALPAGLLVWAMRRAWPSGQ